MTLHFYFNNIAFKWQNHILIIIVRVHRVHDRPWKPGCVEDKGVVMRQNQGASVPLEYPLSSVPPAPTIRLTYGGTWYALWQGIALWSIWACSAHNLTLSVTPLLFTDNQEALFLQYINIFVTCFRYQGLCCKVVQLEKSIDLCKSTTL